MFDLLPLVTGRLPYPRRPGYVRLSADTRSLRRRPQMHLTSYASIVSEPKTARVSLAPVDAKGDPLLDAMEAYSEGSRLLKPP